MSKPHGYQDPSKHCPACGATRAFWQRDPFDGSERPSGVVETCHFEPDDLLECYDRSGRRYVRPDLQSPGWECSHCGRAMSGGDGGWFDTDTGEPQFYYCPFCGRRVDVGATVMAAAMHREDT